MTGSHWKVLNRGIDVIYIFKSSLINQLGGCGSDPRENGGRLGEEELNLGYSLGQKYTNYRKKQKTHNYKENF